MRVKCTITIDDAEFVATASSDGDSDWTYGPIAVASAISSCVSSISCVSGKILKSSVAAHICRRVGSGLLRDAGYADINTLHDCPNGHIVVIRQKSIIPGRTMPENIIPVPDIAAARAALRG